MSNRVIEYLDLTTTSHEPLLDHGLPLGMRGRQLMDIPSGETSFLVRVGPQWRRVETGYYDKGLEILVLDGALTIGGQELGRTCFSYLPAGARTGPWASRGGCDMLLMFKGPPHFVESDNDGPGAQADRRIDCLDVKATPWNAMPGYEGRSREEAGSMLAHKTLYEDPETRAYTYLVRQGAGWSEPKLEAHATWEELILLEGDYLMGHNGLVRAGTYIYRPGDIPHGPQATQKGSVWLARGNRVPDFEWFDEQWARDAVRDYFEARLDDHIGEREPWGTWSADPK